MLDERRPVLCVDCQSLVFRYRQNDDGGLAEASLRYHAFVTEMALLFRLARGAALPANAELQLRTACGIVSDFRDAHGDLFPIGDDDSGRVLAIDGASAMGRADVLMNLARSIFDK